ncbi:unnamed protein product [Prunus armeniaca]
MTGPPSSSYPSQVSPSAVEISPENEEKSSGFDRNFAGFVLRRPAAIFGDPVCSAICTTLRTSSDVDRPHTWPGASRRMSGRYDGKMAGENVARPSVRSHASLD